MVSHRDAGVHTPPCMSYEVIESKGDDIDRDIFLVPLNGSSRTAGKVSSSGIEVLSHDLAGQHYALLGLALPEGDFSFFKQQSCISVCR